MAWRRRKGSTVLEFGPAFLLLFLFLIFPMIDLFMIGVDYSACVTLNQLQAQKAAEVKQLQAVDRNGPVRQKVVLAWRHSGLGALVNVVEDPVTDIVYAKARKQDATDYYAIVTTKLSFAPFLTIPFFPGVPGLGAPIPLEVSSCRLLEDPIHQLNKFGKSQSSH